MKGLHAPEEPAELRQTKDLILHGWRYDHLEARNRINNKKPNQGTTFRKVGLRKKWATQDLEAIRGGVDTKTLISKSEHHSITLQSTYDLPEDRVHEVQPLRHIGWTRH
jgi:hypothetical protein